MKTHLNPRRAFVARLLSGTALTGIGFTLPVPQDAAANEAANAAPHHRHGNAVVHENAIATGPATGSAAINRRQDDRARTASQPICAPRPGAGDYALATPFDGPVQPGSGRSRPLVIDLRQHAFDGPHALTGWGRFQPFVIEQREHAPDEPHALLHFAAARRQGCSVSEAVAEALAPVR